MKNVFDDTLSAFVIVAHPDDETLWAGGTILSYPKIEWTVATLCRKSDPDRAPKFFQAMKLLNAQGFMADLNDEPDQKPLSQAEIKTTILNMLPPKKFDIILTHSPKGEYTKHRRHEETSKAVFSLWQEGKLVAKELLLFAYEDDNGNRLPQPIKDAHITIKLTDDIWQKKKDIITNVYGFLPESFEAKAVSQVEAFWQLKDKNNIIFGRI